MASFPTRGDAGGGVTLIPLPGEAWARELGHTAELGGPAWMQPLPVLHLHEQELHRNARPEVELHP